MVITVKDSGLRKARAKKFVRLLDLRTKQFLHMGTAIETPLTKDAWIGSRTQAENLKIRAQKRGDPFPYEVMRRALHDRTQDANT